MNFMDDSFILDEQLLRAVLPIDKYWKEDGSLSSAAFKDKKGLSVDRTGNRTLEESAAFIRSHLSGTIVWVTVQHCYEAKAAVYYLPLSNNIYHSEIHRDVSQKELSKGQARLLAKKATIISETFAIA